MTFRTPAHVREEFLRHPRRALILTTVKYESLAVKAHLTAPEILVSPRDGFYEYGRFADPSGDWLVVHVLTAQGNADTSLVASRAYQDFGRFLLQIFVGIGGSLKEDIPIGSVVIGDFVYNAHSAKVVDGEALGRPHSLTPALELLTAARALVYSDEWRTFVRAPSGMALPAVADYPCTYPPGAHIKGIASGEEVVAGGNSARYKWIRTHLNDCGAVEMEGWGAMNAARYESTPAIVVRGISDMCAGKEHATDLLHQPIAAAHAAAFAFCILSFRSRVLGSITDPNVLQGEGPELPTAPLPAVKEERRVEFVLNFSGSRKEWPEARVMAVLSRLREALNDQSIALTRIDAGSVRVVVMVRESDVATLDLPRLRQILSHTEAYLLGAAPEGGVGAADRARIALDAASADLLAWEQRLPNGEWLDRPEERTLEERFLLDSSSTVLLGPPGSGKSALLSRIGSRLTARGATVFAVKADLLPPDVRTESDLQSALNLPSPPSDLLIRLAELQPVFVLIDQLDALASQLDLRSGRLNVLLNLIRRVGGVTNVHILLSARTFEFNHDVRLRAVQAEPVVLALPPWHEIKEQIASIGIDAEQWPEQARDVVRIPQALKTFIALAKTGRNAPFTTYQAMLEQLWVDRIARDEESEGLALLAADLATQMAEDEALWLAASRFDDRLTSLDRLEALGFIVRSENSLSVSFSHQTVFEYVLARTFVRKADLLSRFVLERQDSLFLRAKLWSALQYLREAEPQSYEREFLRIWHTPSLRRHLRFLMIESLGQVSRPLRFEIELMKDVLSSPALRLLGLKAMRNSSDWFTHLGSTAVRDAMTGNEAETHQTARILAANWGTASDRVIRLIRERWTPDATKDYYSWTVLAECSHWTEEIEKLALIVLARSNVSVWQVVNLSTQVAVADPGTAMRLVRAKADYLLSAVEQQPAPPDFPSTGTEVEQVTWHMLHRRTKAYEDLLEASEWHELPALAEAAPVVFLQVMWPWYLGLFSRIVGLSERKAAEYVFPGQFFLELDLSAPGEATSSREKPLVSSLQASVEAAARSAPSDFMRWADQNSHLELLSVQQLIAHGLQFVASKHATPALEWLLADRRRFQLGTMRGHRSTSIALVQACAEHWSVEELARYQKAVIEYRPPVPDHLSEPEQRKLFADLVRASRKDLLRAVGVERLSPENRDMVAVEQRALGDRFDRSLGEIQSGWIGSPMEAASMTKAKDRDIVGIFRQIPDDTQWDHPTKIMRGGNVQLSRAFADFARTDPSRAVRIIEQFEPKLQERAAGYALEAMADSEDNDSRVLDGLADLHARGFAEEEFRASAARAAEKVASRKVNLGEGVVSILTSWLSSPSFAPDADGIRVSSDLGDGTLKEGSILWGLGGGFLLPSGNFNILAALTSHFLNDGESGRDKLFVILNEHLARERNPNVWKALLHRLGYSGGATPRIVADFSRKLFARFPDLLGTSEAVRFLAHAQQWDDRLVLDLLGDARESDNLFIQRAFGELVGLVAIAKAKEPWVQAKDFIVTSGSVEMRVGLAHAGVNLWCEAGLRGRATDALVVLLRAARKEVVATVMDVFRVAEELVPDSATTALLTALADDATDFSAAPSHFVVERLQALLPNEAALVAAIGIKLAAAWRGELDDMRTGTVFAAPQLTDLALTLHRLGGESREPGVTLFETMIEIDAYGAAETLAELDGKFGPQQVAVRQRLARRSSKRRRG